MISEAYFRRAVFYSSRVFLFSKLAIGVRISVVHIDMHHEMHLGGFNHENRKPCNAVRDFQ